MVLDPAVFLRRAESYLSSLQDLRDLGNADYSLADPDYRAAIALLAVHSAISFSDAILAFATDEVSRGDHLEAPKRLRAAVKARNISTSPVARFSRLVERKNDFAYGPRFIRPDDVKSAVAGAEQFAAWSYEVLEILRGDDQ